MNYLKLVQDAYAKQQRERGYVSFGYKSLIELSGVAIQFSVDIGSYQGDTYMLVKNKDGHFGYLRFGWGSCSGCDALKGCDNAKDYAELLESLYSNIEWFETQERLIRFREEGDWENRFYGDKDTIKRWIQAFDLYLQKLVEE